MMENHTQEASGLTGPLDDGIAHLAAAAAQLERTAAAIEASLAGVSRGGDVAKVIAAIDGDPSIRLAELEIKVKAVETQLAEMRAHPGNVTVAAGRKTLPAAAAHLLTKHGIDTLEQVNGGALDTALNGLSLEQRIAVKSQLMRAGLLG
jgi:hypothetical protein